jgi:tetratricopeptide (TPR) repeat protein
MLASEIAETYRAMRNYEEADRFYLQAISLAPDKSYYWEGRVFTRLSWTGDVTDARAVLTQAPATADLEILAVRFKVEFFVRDYQKVVSQLTPERLRALQLVDQYRLKTLAVIARERMGDWIGARVLAEENRAELQNLMKLDPKQPFYPAFLAVTLAELGQDAEALALAEKTARETQGDAYTGANFIELQAMAEAILGHRREAVGRLSRLLITQYRWAISANDLRLDPVWDSLRGDPEFEDLQRK